MFASASTDPSEFRVQCRRRATDQVRDERHQAEALLEGDAQARALAAVAHIDGRPTDTELATLGVPFDYAAYDAHRVAQVARVPFAALVVHECERFIVFNKPFDVRIDGEQWPLTLASLYRQHRPALPWPPKFCHQLDYSTSGVITLAKTKRAAAQAGRLFSERLTLKVYSALLFGTLAGDVCIDAPIASTSESNRMRVVPRGEAGGREARTEVIVLAHGTHRGRPMTRVRLRPISGRRHQLRLHTLYIGHPICGDMTYARDGEAFRMMLHAQYLCLPMINEERTLAFETPDPFAGFLDNEVLFAGAQADPPLPTPPQPPQRQGKRKNKG